VRLPAVCGNVVRPGGALARSGVVAVLLLGLWVPAADAFRCQPRPDWMVGVGWGFGRGVFDEAAAGTTRYRDGGTPQIHVGRTLGDHAMVSADYESWFIEFGIPPTKYRRSLQNLALGLSWFPGNPNGPSGGIYLRGTAGLGWNNLGVVEVIEGEEQGNGERTDEWGVGFSADAGYEFWVSRNFTAGLGLSFDWLDIGGDIVDAGRFGCFVLNLNLYF